jgi:hypothetical protein
VRSLALLLAFTSVAGADTSVAPDRSIIPADCDNQQGPFWRARREMRDGWHPGRVRLDGLRDVSATHALYTPPTRGLGAAHVFDRVTGSDAIFTAGVALVEDRAGVLLGVLAIDKGLALVETGGKQRWLVPSSATRLGESLHTRVDGDRLVVASFDREVSGARLFALDLRSGALQWTADVEQMNVRHSAYANDVGLEVSDGVVVMRGFEAAGCYVQRFDAATGRRLSSVIRRQRKW